MPFHRGRDDTLLAALEFTLFEKDGFDAGVNLDGKTTQEHLFFQRKFAPSLYHDGDINVAVFAGVPGCLRAKYKYPGTREIILS